MSTTIRIYEDEECKTLLKERFSEYPFYDEGDDLFDGEDEWLGLLEEVEEEFTENWSAVVTFDNKGNGRRFFRRKHYLENYDVRVQWFFVERLYLFGGDGQSTAKRVFGGSLIYDLDLGKLDGGNASIIGRDEYNLRMINRILELNGETYNEVVVVMNPSDAGRLHLQMAGSYPRIVRLKDKLKVIQLTKLFHSIKLLRSLSISMIPSIRGIINHQIRSLRYIEKFYERIENGDAAIWNAFKKNFTEIV